MKPGESSKASTKRSMLRNYSISTLMNLELLFQKEIVIKRTSSNIPTPISIMKKAKTIFWTTLSQSLLLTNFKRKAGHLLWSRNLLRKIGLTLYQKVTGN